MNQHGGGDKKRLNSLPYQVSDTESAYSTMVQQPNGNIAFYYEETLNSGSTGYEMVYTEIPVDTLTCNIYSAIRR